MKEKSYTIALPFSFGAEKSYTIGFDTTNSVKKDFNLPIELPANSRLQGVILGGMEEGNRSVKEVRAVLGEGLLSGFKGAKEMCMKEEGLDESKRRLIQILYGVDELEGVDKSEKEIVVSNVDFESARREDEKSLQIVSSFGSEKKNEHEADMIEFDDMSSVRLFEMDNIDLMDAPFKNKEYMADVNGSDDFNLINKDIPMAVYDDIAAYKEMVSTYIADTPFEIVNSDYKHHEYETSIQHEFEDFEGMGKPTFVHEQEFADRNVNITTPILDIDFNEFTKENVIDIEIDDFIDSDMSNRIIDTKVDSLDELERISVMESVIDNEVVSGEVEHNFSMILNDDLDSAVREKEHDIFIIDEAEGDKGVKYTAIVHEDDTAERINEVVTHINEDSDWFDRIAINVEMIGDFSLFDRTAIEVRMPDEDALAGRTETEIRMIDDTDQFSRIEIPINVIDGDSFIRNKVLESVEVSFSDFTLAEYSDPKIWLVHSRPYWWNNWNWRKTR